MIQRTVKELPAMATNADLLLSRSVATHLKGVTVNRLGARCPDNALRQLDSTEKTTWMGIDSGSPNGTWRGR